MDPGFVSRGVGYSCQLDVISKHSGRVTALPSPSRAARLPGPAYASREKRKLGGGTPQLRNAQPERDLPSGRTWPPPRRPLPSPSSTSPPLSSPLSPQRWPAQPAASISFLRSATSRRQRESLGEPAGMKAPLAILLLTACLCLDGVFSLVCWSCDGVESNWDCWRIQVCSDQDNYCATTYTGAGIGGYSSQSISKGCVPICPKGGIDIGIAAMSVNCCSSFLCNISGANSIHINHLLLALATLASFFYLFGPRL